MEKEFSGKKIAIRVVFHRNRERVMEIKKREPERERAGKQRDE